MEKWVTRSRRGACRIVTKDYSLISVFQLDDTIAETPRHFKNSDPDARLTYKDISVIKEPLNKS